jgi:hypothetical protein
MIDPLKVALQIFGCPVVTGALPILKLAASGFIVETFVGLSTSRLAAGGDELLSRSDNA